MVFGYMSLPSLLFGVGRYDVTLELPAAGGLYERSNVTYRGTEVGQVEVRFPHRFRSRGGVVAAVRHFDSIRPRRPRCTASPLWASSTSRCFPPASRRRLKDGDVIPVDRASVPPPIDSLVDSANRGLEAIPGDNLRTTIDEAYIAFGGLGPEISRFVKASTALAIDARTNLDAITALTDQAAPVLETQSDTSDSVQAWAAHLATVTEQLRDNDAAVAGILHDGPGAAAEARQLFDRLQPTLPILLANLVSIAPVLVTYRDNLEQILVLLPQGTQAMQGDRGWPTGIPSRITRARILSFNLNFNLPPPCTTGFLPAQQQRIT